MLIIFIDLLKNKNNSYNEEKREIRGKQEINMHPIAEVSLEKNEPTKGIDESSEGKKLKSKQTRKTKGSKQSICN